MTSFVEDLATRILGGAAPAVVGLDPRPQALPAAVLPDAPLAEVVDIPEEGLSDEEAPSQFAGGSNE